MPLATAKETVMAAMASMTDSCAQIAAPVDDKAGETEEGEMEMDGNATLDAVSHTRTVAEP